MYNLRNLRVKNLSDLLYNEDVKVNIKYKSVESFNFISNKLKNNKDFMLQAIEEKDSWCSQYASDELKNDKEFMLQVIKTDLNALQYASDELKADKEFMLEVIENSKLDSKNETDKEKKDKSINLVKTIETGCWCLKYTSEEFRNKLKNDKELLLKYINIDYNTLKYASDELKNDKEFMIKAI